MLILPELNLDEWTESRNTIQSYAKLISEIRRQLTPKARHWFHLSLRTWAKGLTTTPIPIYHSPQISSIEIFLDFVNHHLIIESNIGTHLELELQGQSVDKVYDRIKPFFKTFHIDMDIDLAAIAAEKYSYHNESVENYAIALSEIDLFLKEFVGQLRSGAGPVQLWPDHFDLAVLWFTGRLVPGKDPDDEENADEQMNFGFSTGDSSIPQPYFYITAYPQPHGFTDVDLELPAYWNTKDFTAMILHYNDWIKLNDPKSFLLEFLGNAQQKVADLMK